MFNMHIKGQKLTLKKLDAMARAVESRQMREELKQAMEPVKVLAKQRAPVDTGRTARYITTAVRGGRNKIRAVVQTGTRRQMRIPASAKYYYPAILEFGSRTQPARSFLRSAIRSRRRQVISSLSASVRAALLKAGRRKG